MTLTGLVWIPPLEPWQLIGVPVFTIVMYVAFGIGEAFRDRIYRAIAGRERPRSRWD